MPLKRTEIICFNALILAILISLRSLLPLLELLSSLEISPAASEPTLDIINQFRPRRGSMPIPTQ